MSAHRVPARVTITLLMACSACNIGKPLVDYAALEPKGGVRPVNCDKPEEHGEQASCATEVMLPITMSAPQPLRWQSCAAMCGSGQPDIEAQGDALDAPISCLPLEPLDPALPSRLTCASKRFAVAPLPATATHLDNTITAAHWKNANVVLEAGEPAELIIAGSELSDVRLHLVGPVTVRFQGETTLTGVSISSSSPAARVAFDQVEPEDITIGDSALPFAGHLEARHSSFIQASWVIASAELDSALITGAFVDVQTIVSNDGMLNDVTLELGDALFAPTAMLSVDIRRCESLSFFGSELRRVVIPPCTGDATRIYASKMVGGSLDGVVQGDTSKLDQVRLGQNAPSDFVLWAVSVTSSVFCDEIEAVKVSPNAVQCSSCTERAFKPRERGCLLPAEDLEVIDDDARQNFCEELDMLEPCPEPLPARSRPVEM